MPSTCNRLPMTRTTSRGWTPRCYVHSKLQLCGPRALGGQEWTEQVEETLPEPAGGVTIAEAVEAEAACTSDTAGPAAV
eukprot:15462708-Alexandrium_andersonii.AAC.1